MHDPNTLAFEIFWPWQYAVMAWRKLWRMKHRYFTPAVMIWHLDPEKDGTDNSCGWGTPHLTEREWTTLKKEADYCFEKHTFENSEQKTDVPSLVWGIAWVVNWHLWRRKMGVRETAHVMDLVGNPLDNIRWSVEYCKTKDDLRGLFRIVAQTFKRARRPWYRHPKWHVHHWRIQITFLDRLRRRLFDRCGTCDKPFGRREFPIASQWDTRHAATRWGRVKDWFRPMEKLYHSKCYPNGGSKS